ncbi:MAG: TIR domain-containing protein [Sedimenticola sp.]
MTLSPLISKGSSIVISVSQMGGGDSLYDKIDRGLRGCKAVVSCVTPKYSLSANCRREISLADALKKPVIPLLLEEMKWPPDGPMSMVFTELLYINFYRDPEIQMSWKGPTFDELTGKLRHHVPEIEWTGSGNTQTQTKQTDSGSRNRPPTKATPSDTKQNGKTAVVAEPKPDVKSAHRVATKTTPAKAKAAPKTNDASASKLDSKPTPDKQASKSVPPNKKGTDRSEAIDKTTAKRTPAAPKAVNKASNDTQSNMAKTKSETATGKSLSTPSRKATEAKGKVGTEAKGNANVSSTTNSNSKSSKSCSIL